MFFITPYGEGKTNEMKLCGGRVNRMLDCKVKCERGGKVTEQQLWELLGNQTLSALLVLWYRVSFPSY